MFGQHIAVLTHGLLAVLSFGNDFIIRTDTNGFFDTQIALPAGGYSVEASDAVSGLRGQAAVDVKAGITNLVNVRLLGSFVVSTSVSVLGPELVGVKLTRIDPLCPGWIVTGAVL